jgi:hypothetical protein
MMGRQGGDQSQLFLPVQSRTAYSRMPLDAPDQSITSLHLFELLAHQSGGTAP